VITRGFQGRRPPTASKRLPPGQHLTRDFPVLSAGPTPHTPLTDWTFALEAEDGTQIVSWSWEEFRALGSTEVTVDIHCVTRWSKFDTDWRGISVDRIFAAAGLEEPPSPFVMALCDGGYTTNLPVEDLLEGKALVVWEYDGEPLAPEHGGAGAPPRTAPVFLEVCQVGTGPALHGGQRAGVLGGERLPQLW
jgi:DMSO/TMAO reductase YedYZ molybdopterin-dependent catalytic subunit